MNLMKKYSVTNFVIYQVSDVLFTISIKTIGMLFTWIMLNQLGLVVELGYFLFISWALQVLTLLAFGLYGDKFSTKFYLISFCILSLLIISSLYFIESKNYFYWGIFFIITSLFSILTQPIGNSIISRILHNTNTDLAFRARGLVSSLNVVSGPAISGILISYLAYGHILVIVFCSVVISFLGFLWVSMMPSEKKADTSKVSLKILKNNPTELRLGAISGVFNFVIVPLVSYFIPFLIIDTMKLGAFDLGVAEFFFGAGMFLGSSVLVKFFNHILGKGYASLTGTILVSLGIFGVSISQSNIHINISMLIAGIGVVIYNINTTSIRMTATPSPQRHSMESVFLSLCIIPIPLGMLFSTYSIQFLSVNSILLGMSLILLFCSILIIKTPNFMHLCKMSSESLDGYYEKLYPRSVG
ncbi:MFS transporter [Xenorhabdus bovienii]|uniref:Major facilitator superfamily (MFS) profile domain-containing protein n=1 Tax=Xenorhabdus bovienii TaxID=40576 RepID=A0A0B6X2M4_XENBV|nr:MFS transporter [Xenorhabdus bovienii]CDM87381.1 conserved membrane protein of unknown function [Xenorhabdus bovienii]